MIAWKSGGRQGNTWCPPISIPCRAVRKRGGFPPFTPSASIVQERTRPGNNPRPGAPVKAPLGLPLSKGERRRPCLGPSGGWRPCGARKARRFSPRKSLKNWPLRYALERRPEQSGGTHPLKGVREEKIQRKRGQKSEIHHQAENETGKANRLRRPKAYVPTRAKT